MGSASLITADPHDAVRALEAVAPELLDQIGEVLVGALSGHRTDVRAYVDSYRSLVDRVVTAVQQERPDLVMRDGDMLTLTLAAKRWRTLPIELLEASCLDAPASPWVLQFGSRDGPALHLLATLREWVPAAQPLRPASRWWRSRRHGAPVEIKMTFYLSAVRELSREPSGLARVRDAFALTTTELGGLFDVSRQAIDSWIEKGAPPARQAKIGTLLALVDVLEHQLKRDRLPGIARRPADAYGGRTMLEMIRDDRQDEVLEITRRSFDWSVAA